MPEKHEKVSIHGVFSYGSGLASSFFSLVIKDDGKNLDVILNSLNDVMSRLEGRK